MTDNLNTKVKTATKWSAVTEIAAKLVAPISTMVLARLLTPEAFGVLVTATMVISFAEIFTDAGFQKYIVQKEFPTKDDLYNSTAVAFWSNFALSLIIWAVISIFSSQIAHLVGNDGYGLVITISCVCIPLAAFSSIQMALFKRALDFKTLFFVRIVGILIPVFVTIPLAYLTRSYWSLIIGMIALNISNAIILTWKSEWKPKKYYNWQLFKDMFSFTMWSMIEAVSIWLTNYLDVFIVGTYLSSYYMGLYRTSISTVGQIMALVTSATTPVLFSALSRLQNDRGEFNRLFLNFQQLVSILVVPMGVGIFLFSDTITLILLGNKWTEASTFIGWWGLTSSITVVLSHYSSEIYRALGKPKWSVFVQMTHLLFLVPVVLLSIQKGYDTLCVCRSLVRLEIIIVNMVLVYKLVRISPFDMLMNICYPIIGSITMILIYLLFHKVDSIHWDIACMVVCSVAYLLVIFSSKSNRDIVKKLIIKK